MFVDIKDLIIEGETVAVATSGGIDSMALLHYLSSVKSEYNFNVVCLNVEHGIRGEQSKSDSKFVKDYCAEKGIPCLFYEVNCAKYAEKNKLSLEEGARKLRYECFYDALKGGKCDKVATAHHLSDNAESILFNLFRGAGAKGISGIERINGKIIRPFLSVKKEEIENYVSENGIPFVVDQTNFDTDYTRNYIRHEILPKIEKVFPEAKESICRTAEIIKADDKFLTDLAENIVECGENSVKVNVDADFPVFSRATIIALKYLGVKKDWEKKHIDSAFSLTKMKNGAKTYLPMGIIAIKEYDKIVFYKSTEKDQKEFEFSDGFFFVFDKKYDIISVNFVNDLTGGLYADGDKLVGATVRTMREGDRFTKFGGGTKSLGDYFTDKKIPLRLRNSIPLVAKDNDILVIFGLAVSDKVKVTENTKNIKKFISEEVK